MLLYIILRISWLCNYVNISLDDTFVLYYRDFIILYEVIKNISEKVKNSKRSYNISRKKSGHLKNTYYVWVRNHIQKKLMLKLIILGYSTNRSPKLKSLLNSLWYAFGPEAQLLTLDLLS